MPTPSIPQLEISFHNAVLELIEQIKQLGYTPTYFIRGVSTSGAKEACKALLSVPRAQVGLFKLYEMHHVDLSMEEMVLKSPWNQLFTKDELFEAKRRLEELKIKKGDACVAS